ncbi:MAG: TetR family transcriptional regulator [Deltaproteobacteria bacterium RBG_13_47_9]|nr:MAG: TetR family transcriptional regulator [Deltaproteobacteria bacterium RBG_13_47_9]
MDRNIKMELILDAGEQIMSEKGVQSASIAEIAKKAGVTDSLIYNYFEGKEDLLFSIPRRRMNEVLENLSQQLQGIIDPVSKLSKMIWFHLHFNDTYRGYARLLLLECRSNRNFYTHEAYTLIRKYAGVMLGILTDGVNKGVFRADTDMRVVRDIVFGVLDSEGLSCLAAEEIQETVSDLQDILDLILPMVLAEKSSQAEQKNKSKRILRAAQTVFAQKGYSQATISEIAKSADVSEGTIYEYFKNKDELLLSIAENRFEEYIASMDEVFEIKTPLRKLQHLIRYHFYLFLAERDFLIVFLLHIQLGRRFYNSPVYQVVERYKKIMADILDQGKVDGTIRKSVNPRVFNNMFFGAFSHLALRWLLFGDEGQSDKMRQIDEVVDLLSRSVADPMKKQS